MLLPPERLAAELARVRQGVHVKLPLAEFEERLRRAREARKRPPRLPRLIKARYRATLVEDTRKADGSRDHNEPYLMGTGHWKILHAGLSPAVFSLEPFSLAVRQPRFENRDALIGDFGDAPGLLLDRAGEQTVMFDWTARGDQTPDGIHFDWRVPAAPLALLELDVPAGRVVTVTPESCLVTGPRDAEAAGRCLWEVRFAQRAVLHLTVAPAPEGEHSPDGPAGGLVVEQVRGRHALAAQGETSDFTFDLKVVSRGVRTLSFDCDAPLVPYRVVLPADGPAILERWQFDPTSKPGTPARLTLTFSRAVSGTLHPRVYCRGSLGSPPAIAELRLQIADLQRRNRASSANLQSAIAKLQSSYRRWVCPGLTVRPGPPPRSETIEVRCHPGLRLENWHAGAFRLTGARTEADDTYRLTLAGTGLPAGPEASARPGALIRTQGVDYRARVLAWWRLEGTSSSLTVQVTYDVRHGRLFELPLLIAPGWEVERVWCPGLPEKLRNWSWPVSPGGTLPGLPAGRPATLLTAELQPPLEAAERPSSLFLRLRGPSPRRSPFSPPLSPNGRGEKATSTQADWASPFPVVVPAGGSGVDGGLAIDWDDEWFTASFTGPPPRGGNRGPHTRLVPIRPPAEEGPWGHQSPRAYFAWRDQPGLGTLHLRPRPPRLRTHSLNEVRLTAGRLDLSARLTLAVEAGAVDTVEVRAAAPLPPAASLRWDTADGVRVRGFERLPALMVPAAVVPLASANAVTAATLLAVQPRGERWRLTLTRPLRANQALTLHAAHSLRWPPVPAAEALWPVPLLTFGGAAAGAGEVRLTLPPGDLSAAVRTTGMRERTAAAQDQLRPGRVFVHDSPLALDLWLPALGQKPAGGRWPAAEGRRPLAVVPRATLLTRVDPGGRLVHLFTFEVRDWPQPTLPLRLPAGTRLAAIRVDGRDATGSLPGRTPVPGEEAGGQEVELPVPAPRLSASGKDGTAALHSFEVLYVTETRPWWLWARLEAALPGMPLRPLALRRVWRLPSAFAPVSQGHLLRLPGTASAGLLGRVPTPPALMSWALALGRWGPRQEQAVRAADARLRRAAAGQKRTLAEALRQMARADLAEEGGLVVDAAALHAAGLRPQQVFVVGGNRTDRAGEEPAGPALAALEPLGLVYAPFRAAAVVTTRRQWQQWQRLDPAAAPVASVGETDPEPYAAAAVAEAVAYGHDVSGRFRTAADWLAGPAEVSEQATDAAAPLLEEIPPADRLVTWTDWEETPGASADAPLWVVRAGIPAGGGLVLAGLLLLVSWWVRWAAPTAGPPRRGPLALLLLWLGGAGLACLWLPAGLRDLAWWPLVAGGIIALWWYVTLRWHDRPARADARGGAVPAPTGGLPVGVTTAGVLALCWATWTPGPAAPPPLPIIDSRLQIEKQPLPSREDLTVYLLPEGTSVLVTPALLTQLAPERAGRPLPGAVLVGAEYQGAVKKPDDQTARFEAVFQVFCPGAGPAMLELPLDGVVLDQEPLLDGARAPLTALPPGAGYRLKVAGAGLHKIQLSFEVNLGGDGDFASLRFTIPRVPQNRLALRLPPGTSFPQALVKLGAQRVTEDRAGLLLEVDVGAFTAPGKAPARGPNSLPLFLRWRHARRDARPGVQFKEAHLWDLGQRGHALSSVLSYHVGPGSVSRLTIDIPPELRVSRVEARRPDAGAGAAEDDSALVRLRDWHLDPPEKAARDGGGLRPLHLDFHAPVAGAVRVVLVFYPRDGFFDAPRRVPATVTLPLPRPRGTPVPQEGFLAYRLQGLDAQRTHNVRVVGIETREFPAFFWQAVPRGEPLAYACRISRERDQGPVLRLAVQPRPARRQGSLRLAWRLGSEYADLHATLDLKAPAGDLALVEWEVAAPVEVTAVRGPELREWSWARRPGGGGRLQVWLRSASTQAHLELTAETPVTRIAAGDPRGLLIGGPLSAALRETLARSGRFHLPILRVLGMDRSPLVTTVELTSGPGLAVAAKGVRQLVPAAAPALAKPSDHRLVYAVRRDDYAGEFAVTPAPLPTVKIFTVVEVENRRLKFRTRIEATAAAGGVLRSLGLHLGGWPGTSVLLEAPQAVQRSGVAVGAPAAREHSWEVDWEQRAPAAAVLTLSGAASLDEVVSAAGALRRGLPVPDVRVSGAAAVERWLATGSENARFRLDVAGQAVPEFLRSGPESAVIAAEAKRVRQAGGRVWRLGEEAVGLSLQEEAGPAPPVRVVLREQLAAVLDQQRWLHQTTWWLYHDTPAALAFSLPAGVEVLGVAVDGVPAEFRFSRDDAPPSAGSPKGSEPASTIEAYLSLGGSGARRVCLCWYYRPGKEELSHPLLAGPRLREEQGPVLWTLHVPPGFRSAPETFQAGPAAAARLEVQRAVAQYRLSKRLLESASGRLAPRAGDLFESQLLACQQRFARHGRNADQLLPRAGNDTALAAGLHKLRQDNRTLLDRHGLGSLHRKAEESSRSAAQDAACDLEALVVSGRPLYRLEGDPDTAKTSAPAAGSVQPPRLVATADLERRRALAATGLLAGLLLAVWVLSSFPAFVSLTHLFWPEQIILLGLLGYQTFGPTWPVVFLVALGIVARVLALGSGLLALFRRPHTMEPRRA